MIVTIKPKSESLLVFLEKQANLIGSNNEALEWQQIEPRSLPICLVDAPTSRNAFVLYNKTEYDKYRVHLSNTDIKYTFYIIAIEKLWDVSDLFSVRSSIERDRIFVNKPRTVLTAERKKAVIEDIFRYLYKEKDLNQIAIDHNITRLQARQILANINEILPEDKKFHISDRKFDYGVIIRNLARTKPELNIPQELIDKSIMQTIHKPKINKIKLSLLKQSTNGSSLASQIRTIIAGLPKSGFTLKDVFEQLSKINKDAIIKRRITISACVSSFVKTGYIRLLKQGDMRKRIYNIYKIN